jgi:phage shock protein PspC (stress-responsive transcriptional regulator)
MKEITRIHIAKVPYDIELAAKKELERYIHNLEAYADDDDLLQDIEIRITELLTERNVLAGGIISFDDVATIREQLGEPKDFMGEGDMAIGGDIEISGDATRKLFRNTDSAVLGGVLSGVASFFSVNPTWVRLAFIILSFASFGTVLLLYIVLWIVVPPARTAAEKLQMNGRPVTLSSIRELNEIELNLTVRNERATTVRRIIMVLGGTGALIASIGVLLLTIFAAFSIIHSNEWQLGARSGVEWVYVSAYILAIIAGVLLAMLFAVGAYAAFTRKISKRLVVGAITIVVMGIVSFGTAAGIVIYQPWQDNYQMQRSIKESVVDLPVGFSGVKSLTVDSSLVNVEYVTDTASSIAVRELSGAGKPIVKVDGTNATISFESLSGINAWAFKPVLTIHGPKLDNLVVRQGFVIYSANSQDLTLEATGQSSVVLNSGTFGNLNIKASDQSSVDASGVTVLVANVDTRTSANVSLGTIKSLSVIQSEACPAGGNTTAVSAFGVNTNKMQYNGVMMDAKTHQTNCGTVNIDDGTHLNTAGY